MSIIIEGGNVREETYFDLLNRDISSDTDAFKKLEIYKYIKEVIMEILSNKARLFCLVLFWCIIY